MSKRSAKISKFLFFGSNCVLENLRKVALDRLIGFLIATRFQWRFIVMMLANVDA